MRTLPLIRVSSRFFILLATLFIVASACVSYSQTFNRPVPNTLPQYEFQRYDMTDLGSYYLVAPYPQGSSNSPKSMMVLDQDGYIVWWTAGDKKIFDFKYHQAQNVFSFTRKRGAITYHYIMDSAFTLIDSLYAPIGSGDIHELQIFPNGNYCFLGLSDTLMDLSSYTINGSPGSSTTNLLSMRIWELDPNHNVVMQWNSIDHIPPDVFQDSYNYIPSSFDYVHGNAIELDTDGNLLISIRTANAVYKIDRITGEVIWRLGGTYNEFTFLNDNGFAGQHDIRRLPNGNITIFDNQFGTPQGSRVVEYELNLTNSTVSMVNEYAYNWPLNCYALGSYRQLENGYEIIGWGNTRRPEPSVTLIDSNKDIAADIFFADTIVTYRAFFQEFELSMNQPEISCSDDGVTLSLSAPPGHNFYLWSTGETSETINVADTGVYVVWVDQGIGMLGSAPYHITDIETHCSQVGIDEQQIPNSVKSLGYYDLLGRKLIHIPTGEIYLENFSNGKSIKRIRWE